MDKQEEQGILFICSVLAMTSSIQRPKLNVGVFMSGGETECVHWDERQKNNNTNCVHLLYPL